MIKPQKGSNGLTFARPLESRTGADVPPSVQESIFRPGSALALGGLVTLACAVFLVQTRQDSAQNLSASTHKKPLAAPNKSVRIARAERGAPADKAPPTSRPSLDYYTKGVRGSLFSAPLPPKPKEAPVAKQAKMILPKVPPVFVNPFADWNYAGSVTAGDQKMALLENRITKEGVYVREGQSFMGFAQVKTVGDQMVTLVSAGKPTILAKSDEMNTTPLTASAGYLTKQPDPQQMGGQPQNVQMAMMTAMEAQMAGAKVGMTLPNGKTLTAQQAERFTRRMNGRFDGTGGQTGGQGGGSGGGGGRGGGGRRGRGGGGVMVAPLSN